MEIGTVTGRLHDAEVSFWLDSEGKLRITKDAPPELKELAREHKQALTDIRKAIGLLNAAGAHRIRLPLGHAAMAYRLGSDVESLRWAMKVLDKESMPLVIDDEGLRSMSWDEWRLRQPLLFGPVAQDTAALDPQPGRRLKSRRKKA